MKLRRYCLNCGTQLLDHIDNDPNGQQNCICACCEAEENHDWDAEPHAIFDRDGQRIDEQEQEEDLGLMEEESVAIVNCEKTNTINLILSLTQREIELLRQSTSVFGIEDKNCISLQLKIANAILDAKS